MFNKKNFPSFRIGKLSKATALTVSVLLAIGFLVVGTVLYARASSGNITESTTVQTQFGIVTQTTVIGGVTTTIQETDALVIQPEVVWINSTTTTTQGGGTATVTSATTTTVTLSTVTCNTGGIC